MSGRPGRRPAVDRSRTRVRNTDRLERCAAHRRPARRWALVRLRPIHLGRVTIGAQWAHRRCLEQAAAEQQS